MLKGNSIGTFFTKVTTRDTPTLKTCHISLEALIKTLVPFLSKAIQEGK